MKALLKYFLWAIIPLLLLGCSKSDSTGTYELTPQNAYIDIDEWRETPVRHRYVHGGFTGTDTRFSMYFPPREQYGGRFFQPLQATSGSENTAPEAMAQSSYSIQFAIASGAYLVESNQGRRNMFVGPDPTLTSYRASAAVAVLSRVIAQQMYGQNRPYGYVFGGSGGAYRTLSCMENTQGVWDGGLPFVMGSPVSIPNVFTVQAHAIRVLWNKFPSIIDALEPGGSGDMYSSLNTEEREALAEVTRMGFPPRAWFNLQNIAYGYTGVFSTLMDAVISQDPSYFSDFWKVSGYLGANPPASLLKARITNHNTSITRLIMPAEAKMMGIPLPMPTAQTDTGVEFPAAIVLASLPVGNVQGASIIIQSGAAKGSTLYIIAAIPIPGVGNIVMVGFGENNFAAMGNLRAGDQVIIDNSDYLALQTFHRHQNPGQEYLVWNQFKGPGGVPLFPQRPLVKGAVLSVKQDGRFSGKMIVLGASMDESAYPWQSDWYHSKVKAVLGERLDDNFRIWFSENTMHTSPVVPAGATPPVITTRIVSYQGALQQGLRYLSDWVEKGVPPPPSSNYSVVDGQVQAPSTAAGRRGIQPVVTLTANGGKLADVKVGETVNFSAVIEAPPGSGAVALAEWDFEGTGGYALVKQFTNKNSASETVTATYAFTKAGTYFPVLRASAQRQADFGTSFGRAQNLDRVRVVVK